METHGDIESMSPQDRELEKFLMKLSSPIIRKARKDVKMKYFDKAPHPAIHNHHTIKWLRQRVNGNTIEKSVMSLMPNNGECMIEEDTSSQKYKLKQFLKEYYKKQDKFNKIEITPKYFFSELIMNKIKKLRDIFLEFDEDGSRKLEIDEMVIMFKTNNIKVVQEDLKTLFFKDDKKLSDDDLYLDFYQFMEFALNKECDQDFRLFMRKLKNKKHAGSDRKSCLSDDLRSSGILSNKDFNYDASQSILGTNNEGEDTLFLPMNFNLLLDYFNNKGKQRVSMSKIQDAIEIMTRIIDGGIDNYHAKDKEKETIHHKDNEENQSNHSYLESHEDNNNHQNETDKENKKQKLIEENFKLHDALDCRLLLEEFRKLFAQKPTADYEDNATAIIEKLFQGKSPSATAVNNNDAANNNHNRKKKKGFYGNLKAGKNSNSAEIFRLIRSKNNNNKAKNTNESNNDNNNNNTNCDASMSNVSGLPGNAHFSINDYNNNNNNNYDNKQDDMVFTNYIKNRLESKDPNEISLKQYNKYKSLLLAFEETKKCINNADSSVISGNTGHNTKSTGYTLSQRKSVFNNNSNLNNKYNQSSNKYQPNPFQFRADFYNNTTKDWNKENNLLSSEKKQGLNIKSSNTKFNMNASSNNKTPDKFSKTSYINGNSSRINPMSRKIKLPDPQYNFNYQAKYFGVDEHLDKNNHKYENFLLPLLTKKEKEKHDNTFVPKTLLMELKQRNEI